MPDGEDFVEDGEVKWGGRDGVAGALAGAVLALVGYAAARWVELWSSAFDALTGGLAWFSSSLITTPLEGGVGIMSSAWTSFAAFLPTLGLLAFPAAVATTIAVFVIILWGVRRLVYGV